MNKLIENIKKESIKYGSIPFWSWNDKLTEDELRRQIRKMHEIGMNGFFMHARGGLITEYMEDEWFECIKICIDEAKALGMEAWAYDENGWPSGFAGGKLLADPDNHAVFIEGEISDTYPMNKENILAVYSLDWEDRPTLIDSPSVVAARYLIITKGKDSSYVDTMRSDITDKFIKETHEVYKKRLSDDFGCAMPGFFTDEPQYYRWKTAYSEKMDEWFIDEYGYSALLAIPSLFIDYPGAKEHRYDYHSMAMRKFTEGFSKRIYDYAEENGIMITGHFVEEGSLDGQMCCCGDIMAQYLYEHIPGIDYLGRDLKSDLIGRQLGSVASQTGRKKALSEMFACCGWDVSPKELKHIAELQYSGGVNLMCQHLYPYSIRGQRKRDYPAFYSEHNPWQSDMGAFNLYFNNLGYILSLGKEQVDTLVIHPIRSAWLHYQKFPIKKIPSTLNDELEALTYLLSGNQISYHYGSETIMENSAYVEEGKIHVGLMEYKRIIIPSSDTLTQKTVNLISEFIRSGGEVLRYGDRVPTRIDGREANLDFLKKLPDIKDAEVFKKLRESESEILYLPDNATDKEIRMQVRKTEYGKIIYITNISDKEFFNVHLKVRGASAFGRIDLDTLSFNQVSGKKTEDGCEMVFNIYGSESIVLSEFDSPEFLPFSAPEKYRTIKLDKPFTGKAPSENMIALDRIKIKLGNGEFSEERPIEKVRDELLYSRYRGEITLRFTFDVKYLPKKIRITTEPFGKDAIIVNGKTVNLGSDYDLDRSFNSTDITEYVKIGENTVDMTVDYYQRDYVYYVLYGGVSETLRNCLVFDTEIECAYLFGDFAVDTNNGIWRSDVHSAYVLEAPVKFSLMKQKESVNAENIVTDGYPFFCGNFTSSSTYTYKKGDPTVLRLTGRFATAHVKVNGKYAGLFLFSSYLDLSDHLIEGENEITVTLTNAYRNLLGPHHSYPAEPYGVSPRVFSFETKWINGECPQFKPYYAFVRYGIDQN